MKREEYILELEEILKYSRNSLEAGEDLVDLGIDIIPIVGTQKIPLERKNKATGKWEKQFTEDGSPVYKGEKVPSVGWYGPATPMTYSTPKRELRKLLGADGAGIAIAWKPEDDILCIDADTPEEIASLSAWWLEVTGEELPAPTVKTPGMVNSAGETVHKDGGHWYLAMSEHWYKDMAGIAKKVSVTQGTASFEVKCHVGYNIVPPTKRTEGSYSCTGEIIWQEDYPGLEEALYEKFDLTRDMKAREEAQKQAEKKRREYIAKARANPFHNSELTWEERAVIWGQNNSWEDILIAAGCAIISHPCEEGCVEFYWPGASQQRSGVAHEPGCSQIEVGAVQILSTTMHNVLQIGSQNSAGTWVASKTQFACAALYKNEWKEFAKNELV